MDTFVRLKEIPILKAINGHDDSQSSDWGNDVVAFYETLPADRVIAIDECNLYLFGGGDYWTITTDMIEENVNNVPFTKELTNKSLMQSQGRVHRECVVTSLVSPCEDDCRFFKSGDCLRKDIIKIYFNYSDVEFLDFFKNYKTVRGDRCIFFEQAKRFKIIEFDGAVAKTEISVGEIIYFMDYSISNLAYAAGLYGIESFTNTELLGDVVLQEIKDKLLFQN